MEPRLATSVLAGALMRAAEAEGGFATVVCKGDPHAGSIVILLAERGGAPRIWERALAPDGLYRWCDTENQGGENPESLQKFLTQRRKFDPDLWIIELDVPSAERFTAEMTAFD